MVPLGLNMGRMVTPKFCSPCQDHSAAQAALPPGSVAAFAVPICCRLDACTTKAIHSSYVDLQKFSAPIEWAGLRRDGSYSRFAHDLMCRMAMWHFSTSGRPAETAAKHFLLARRTCFAGVETDRLGDALKWEVVTGQVPNSRICIRALALRDVVYGAAAAVGGPGRMDFPLRLRRPNNDRDILTGSAPSLIAL